MKHETFQIASHEALDRIPESCGSVAVGCSQAAGIVQAVIDTSERLRAEHAALRGTVTELETDQRKVAEASDEARILSDRAIERLGEGTRLIDASLDRISELVALVDTLGQHVTGFAAAMEQVRKSSRDIEQVAETTNILALNATIEAMRAGEAGRTFGVVANEVKTLAGETRRATEEIARTIDKLDEEAGSVVAQIENSAAASNEGKSSIAAIKSTLDGVSALVGEVDQQNDQIAHATATISAHVGRVNDVSESFDRAARENESRLQEAYRNITTLELTASDMFDSIVKGGLSPADSAMVEKAVSAAKQVVQLTEAALADGSLTMEALFDTGYQPVSGSNPMRYHTALTEWADCNWRPFNDRIIAQDPTVRMCSQADMNGFLPTHVTERSRKPTGDVTHDTKFCRNGRILFDPIDQKAKRSSAPYMMAVYRQEGDGHSYQVVRNIYVPLIINDRRWGDLEIAYIA